MTFEIENVSKVFESGEGKEDVTALKDINLTIETGEFISFVGPSGCGKTTLLRIIEGFENPTEGTVKDDGKIVTGPSNERGFIFQNYSLYPWLNVIDNVVFGLGINGKPEKESKERAIEYLESVGLKDFADSYPHELSGGMKQRVAIIRSLINDSKSLLSSVHWMFRQDTNYKNKFIKFVKNNIRQSFSLHMTLMKQYFYQIKLSFYPEDLEESRKFLKLNWSIQEIERIKNLKG